MRTLYIDAVTFGDMDHVKNGGAIPRCPYRTYQVSDRVADLFNAWRFNVHPEQFIAGLVADAMDDEEGVEKDAVWELLVKWMRSVFDGNTDRHKVGQNWHSYSQEAFPGSADSLSLT